MLLFADDLVVLAESQQDLEAMLKVLYDYSLFWRFKYNYEKCGVIRFKYENTPRPKIISGKCTDTCNCGFHYRFGPHLINEVLSYKYLGIEINYKLSFPNLNYESWLKHELIWDVFGRWVLGVDFYQLKHLSTYIKHWYDLS
jgi:hypothetical protein